MGFRVRAAEPADGPALQRLWRELDQLHARLQPGFFRPPRGQPRPGHLLERALRNPDEALLVAEPEGGDGAPCGLVLLRVYHTPPSAPLSQRRRAHVEDLIVDAAQRGRGCGRALMAAAVAWATERDAGQLLLTVWDGNSEAEAFYRRLGYHKVSTVLGLELTETTPSPHKG